MTKLTVLAAFLAALSIAHPVQSETGRDGFAARNAGTQAQTVGKGLRSLFNALRAGEDSRRKPEPVSYSQDWLDRQPTPQGDDNWKCLSEALYFEARGETVKGQFAVAEVIMNRVKSSRFPDTPCAVIRQGTGKRFQCQFTYTCDGQRDVIAEPLAYRRVSKVARAIIDGAAEDLTDGATYYHNTSVRPRWAERFTKTARIGVHLFYRPGIRTASND
ncbi:MAG: cell wall hydrolase [Jhaorihella sp.]